MFYADEHDTNGYHIEHNNRVAYQCTTMTHTMSRVTKTNTCYTSGLLFLKNGDVIKTQLFQAKILTAYSNVPGAFLLHFEWNSQKKVCWL